MNLVVSERVIEDVLIIDKSILESILNISDGDLNLLARQKVVSSGILDLLYVYKDELILIELKVVPFYNDIIKQINGYHNDLIELQNKNKLVNSPIRKIVMVTSANESHNEKCLTENIELVTYSPSTILSLYYENFKEFSHFLTIKSGDFGMVRLGLLNSTLQSLGSGLNIEGIAKKENRSNKTIRNRISIAIHLNLVTKVKTEFYLTEMGLEFVDSSNSLEDRLADNQKSLILNFLKQNPFFSSVTYTIFTMVESVFILSKNNYPVKRELLEDYFVKSTGKTTSWKTKKSQETATYIFSNYALELDLLAKVDNDFFITPAGVHLVLLLQLNRSLKLIENQKPN